MNQEPFITCFKQHFLASTLVVSLAFGAFAQESLISPGSAGATSSAMIEPKDRTEQTPEEIEGIDIEEHLNAQLPLDLEFKDQDGRKVKLGNFFQGKKPVILNLGYYRCPMLCNLVLNGMVDALKFVPLLPGRDFEIVVVSIDPLETPPLARVKMQNYIKSYEKPESAPGWHFLTGKSDSIKKLADAVGFRYKYIPETEEFAHPGAIYTITPDGRISRYLYGVMFDGQTMRLSLVEASEGKIGSTIDRILLYCFHYDAENGKYAPVAMTIMKAGGFLSMLIVASVLSVFWRREWIQKRFRSEGTQN